MVPSSSRIPAAVDHLASVSIIGAGPNGLAAAVTLARAGLDVTVYEAADQPGGGTRTAELIEPGTWHDVCSAVHPGALASPFFRRFGLAERIAFVTPEVAFGQPRAGRPAVVAARDLEHTVDGLGTDGPGWRRVFRPLIDRSAAVAELTSDHPLYAPKHLPAAVPIGLRAASLWQPVQAARLLTGAAADLFSGAAGHASQPLSALSTTLTGLTLATQAHTVGWPMPVGGSYRIAEELVRDLTEHGGKVVTGHRVRTITELPATDAMIFDTSVWELITIAGSRLPGSYRRRAARFRAGPGIGKVDFVLSEPVPWRDPDLHRAATVHLSGSREELAAAELAVHRGRIPEHPMILASEPTRFDPSRSEPGRHVLWAYAHLPAGCTVDPTAMIIAELERHAPGFTETIIASVAKTSADAEHDNPNYRGGDIYAGALTTRQTLFRPMLTLNPWRIGKTDLYLCSSATAPGPGVHGMGGYRAAVSALRHTFNHRATVNLSP